VSFLSDYSNLILVVYIIPRVLAPARLGIGVRGEHRAGTDPVPTKPDPDCGRNSKPTPDPDCVRLVGIGIGRYRLVGIGPD
jgi:hypothetical protein